MIEKKHDPENLIQNMYGVVLLKPDTVIEDVFEYIIYYILTKLQEFPNIKLSGVYPTLITKDKITLLYPGKPAHFISKFENYLTTEPSIVLCFQGNGDQNIWKILTDLKGKSIKERSRAELIDGTSVGIERGVRGLIPLPHLREKFSNIYQMMQKDNERFILNDEDFDLYMRNMIHTPDTLEDFNGILTLLTQDQIMEAFSEA